MREVATGSSGHELLWAISLGSGVSLPDPIAAQVLYRGSKPDAPLTSSRLFQQLHLYKSPFLNQYMERLPLSILGRIKWGCVCSAQCVAHTRSQVSAAVSSPLLQLHVVTTQTSPWACAQVCVFLTPNFSCLLPLLPPCFKPLPHHTCTNTATVSRTVPFSCL